MKVCPACSRTYANDRSQCEHDGAWLVAIATGAGFKPEQLIGQTVDGRYRVEAIIGRGGMGTVYRCQHVIVGRPFAMKVLRPGVEQTEGVLQRFIREAQTANAIKSRHIAETTDFGQLPSGPFYVVMELLVGRDLGKALKQGLSPAELIHVFIQVAETLDQAHSKGIVHRDLKPDNVFLVDEENDPLFVKLLDFGIAKVLGGGPSGLTETGVILGTPYYMSPEQAHGDQVDHRTDIYSLGVIMYRAFTGKLPFVADSAVGVITRHLTQAPELPSRVGSVDPLTERVILTCLEKQPARRYPTMRHVAEALRAIRRGDAPRNAMRDEQTRVDLATPPGAMPSGSAPIATASSSGLPVPSGPWASGPHMHQAPHPYPVPPPPPPSHPSQAFSGAYGAPPPAPPSHPSQAFSGAYGAPPPAPPSHPSHAFRAPSGAFPQQPAGSLPAHAAAPNVPSVEPHVAGMNELTQRGLATSAVMRRPKTSRAALAGGALAAVAIGGAIAVTVGLRTSEHGPAPQPSALGASATPSNTTSGSTADPAISATPNPTTTPAAPSASATASTTAAAPIATVSAAAPPTATPSAEPSTKKGQDRGPKPPPTSTTKRPGEIRSPFD